jgi:hypothetical protein
MEDCSGCGNGILDPGEECDDGSANTNTPCVETTYANPPDTCSTCTKNCTIDTVLGPYCGDGTCSNGETKTSCPVDCSGCGNGIVSGTEQCDDGSANTNTPCTTPAYDTANPSVPLSCSTCTLSCTVDTVFGPFCGDHICQANETAIGCPADCGCGNGIINTGEQCDNGSNNSNTCGPPAYDTAHPNIPLTCTTCTMSCQLLTIEGPYCGDGTCNNGETETSCPVDCTGCGNGIVEGTEQCDDGSNNTNTPCATPAYDTGTPSVPLSCSTCTKSCTVDTVFGPFCGDLICQTADGETAATCPADCGCGNGIVNTGEQCDNGTAHNTDTPCTPGYDTTTPSTPLTCSTCTTSCTIDTVVGPYCGDSIVQSANETCDQGSANGTHTCPYGELSCTICNSTCSGTSAGTTLAYCGDGVVQSTDGEACDNGSNATTNQIVPAPGPINGQTECPYLAGSAATSNTCVTCNSVCTAKTAGATGPFCGDGVVDGEDGETCDDMHANETPGCTDPANPCTKCLACTTTNYLANGSACIHDSDCGSLNCMGGTCM